MTLIWGLSDSKTSHEGIAQACQDAELPFLIGGRMQREEIHAKAKCCEDALILTNQAAGSIGAL